MMTRAHAALFLMALVSNAFAAFETVPHGARLNGMGSAGLAVAGNEWAAFSNPALLTTVDEHVVSVAYVPRLFELPELARASFSWVEPTSVGTFSLSGTRFGFALYRETSMLLSYGCRCDQALSLGVTLAWYSLTIHAYGSAWTVSVDLAALLRLSDAFTYGARAQNVTASTIGRGRERLPRELSTGLAYRPAMDATVSVDLVKDSFYPVEIRMGAEYWIAGVLALRGGITTEPSVTSVGAGVRSSLFALNYALQTHAELGISQFFSLSLFLGAL